MRGALARVRGRHRPPRRRPHAADGSVPTICGRLGNQRGKLSARQGQEVRAAGHDLTCRNREWGADWRRQRCRTSQAALDGGIGSLRAQHPAHQGCGGSPGRPKGGNAMLAWLRDLTSRERRTMLACWGRLADSTDVLSQLSSGAAPGLEVRSPPRPSSDENHDSRSRSPQG